MAYRYSNTDKWTDSWFSDLKQLEMLLFIYLCDNCDIAGFIEVNYKRWASDLNTTSSSIEGALKGLRRGLIPSKEGDCVFIRNFLKHQKNIPLCPEKNPAHRGIVKRFNEYRHKFDFEDYNEFMQRGFEGASKGLQRGTGNGNNNNKNNNKDFNDNILLDCKNEIFEKLWQQWKHYKKSEFNDSYKTVQSEQIAFNKFYEMANADAAIGAEIIEQSISNRWKGLFRLKVTVNNSQKPQNNPLRDAVMINQQIKDQVANNSLGEFDENGMLINSPWNKKA